VTTEKKIADCFSRTMHARRGLHALACSNYFRSFLFWGGGTVGIRDLPSVAREGKGLGTGGLCPNVTGTH